MYCITHCNTLSIHLVGDVGGKIGQESQDCITEHVATHCNTLQHTATGCNARAIPTFPATTLSRSGCNTLLHAATRCNTLQHAATDLFRNFEIKTKQQKQERIVEHVATHHNALQYTAPRCNAQQHAATAAIDCSAHAINCTTRATPAFSATSLSRSGFNTLQHTATHCNTLQHTAKHCNALENAATDLFRNFSVKIGPESQECIANHAATRCNALRHTAKHCNKLQQTFSATSGSRSGRKAKSASRNTLQQAATHSNTLQHAATRCNTLQQAAAHCNKPFPQLRGQDRAGKPRVHRETQDCWQNLQKML